MGILLYVGIVLTFMFFVVWFFRNALKYMYKKQWTIFNRILWWGLLPLSAVGIALIIVGALVHV